jgi:hypothetical protein
LPNFTKSTNMPTISPKKKGAKIQRLAKMADSMVRSKALGDLLMVIRS